MFILSKLHGTSKKSIIPLPWGHPIPVGPGAASSKLTPLSPTINEINSMYPI